MTRTEKLVQRINEIVRKYEDEINKLDNYGPKGGTNARDIVGWTHSPNGTITRAANMSPDCPVKNWWSGSAPTPASAIPECIFDEVYKEYKKIF